MTLVLYYRHIFDTTVVSASHCYFKCQTQFPTFWPTSYFSSYTWTVTNIFSPWSNTADQMTPTHQLLSKLKFQLTLQRLPVQRLSVSQLFPLIFTQLVQTMFIYLFIFSVEIPWIFSGTWASDALLVSRRGGCTWHALDWNWNYMLCTTYRSPQTEPLVVFIVISGSLWICLGTRVMALEASLSYSLCFWCFLPHVSCILAIQPSSALQLACTPEASSNQALQYIQPGLSSTPCQLIVSICTISHWS